MKAKISLFVFCFSIYVFFSCSGRNNEIRNDIPMIVEPVDFSKFEILSPAQNETWEPGKNLLIKWTFPKEIPSVKISIYRKSELIAQITVKTENSGYFEWMIPEDFRNSVHYRINIAAYDNSNINMFSDYFYIINR